MIHIIFGDDINASYAYLSTILKGKADDIKVWLGDINTLEQFKEALYSEDFFKSPKLIICENWLKNNKISSKDIKNIPSNKNVVFWERGNIATSRLVPFRSIAQIREFKLKDPIYQLLDNISPNTKRTLQLLYLATQKESINFLLWNLQNRIYKLILAKISFQKNAASEILNKKIADWQWQKIQEQAALFNLNTLKLLFSGLIKIDYLIKSGATNLNESTLISMLFVKYLAK